MPIGYTVDENQFFQIDPVTGPAVLEAFTRYANGGNPIKEITDLLNEKGVRTNSSNQAKYGRKRVSEAIAQ